MKKETSPDQQLAALQVEIDQTIAKKARVSDIFDSANIPTTYASQSFETFEAKEKTAKESLDLKNQEEPEPF